MPPAARVGQNSLNEGSVYHLRVKQSDSPYHAPAGTQHLSLDPREGGGTPTSFASFPEASRARLRRLGVGKDCQH